HHRPPRGDPHEARRRGLRDDVQGVGGAADCRERVHGGRVTDQRVRAISGRRAAGGTLGRGPHPGASLTAGFLAFVVFSGLHWVAVAAPVSDEDVQTIASQLRCVVCQNLSVADSPSEMAHQMRDLIRERLAAGDRPEEVKAYFVQRYGDWVLLAPPARGFNLLLWLAPFGAVAGGLVLVLTLVRRWRRPPL